MPNRVRLLIASNEDWVVPAASEERRFAVVDVGTKHQKDDGYFGELERELSEFRAATGGCCTTCSPATGARVNLRRIPHTEALLEQKFASLELVDQFWLDVLKRGDVSRRRALAVWPSDPQARCG